MNQDKNENALFILNPLFSHNLKPLKRTTTLQEINPFGQVLDVDDLILWNDSFSHHDFAYQIENFKLIYWLIAFVH